MDDSPVKQVQYARQAPPDYDTLSIAPPCIDVVPPPSPRLTRPQAVNHDAQALRKKSLKEKWQELKEEDKERKAARIQHVTRDEADRITGLDKYRELEPKKFAEKRGGIKSSLGILFLS